MYEQRMKVFGKQIEVKWFGVGHLGSLAQMEQAIEQKEEMLRFAYRVVGQWAKP
jgi:hypothetical protein